MSGSILVVGGGIAGRAVARTLLQHGQECTILEQRPDRDGLGMGLNLPGNATRALAQLGVADEVLGHGVRILRREYRNAAGRLLFAVDDDAFWRGVGPPVCVRHGHLLRALHPPAPVRWEEGRVVSVVPVQSAVEVRIEGEPRPRRYDFVIGADGVHSAVRAAISTDAQRPSAMTQTSWRFVTDNPGVDCWTAWSGADSTLLLIPVERGRVYGYAASSRGGATGEDPDWLAQTFTRFPQPATRATTSAVANGAELHHGAVDEVRMDRWHNGRLVLVGDAAHATGPVWAQGVSMALEDALVIGELLTGGRDWDDVGADFERLRRPRVEHVQAATDHMSRLARLPGWLRTTAAPVLGPRAYRSAYTPLRDPVRIGLRSLKSGRARRRRPSRHSASRPAACRRCSRGGSRPSSR